MITGAMLLRVLFMLLWLLEYTSPTLGQDEQSTGICNCLHATRTQKYCAAEWVYKVKVASELLKIEWKEDKYFYAYKVVKLHKYKNQDPTAVRNKNVLGVDGETETHDLENNDSENEDSEIVVSVNKDMEIERLKNRDLIYTAKTFPECGVYLKLNETYMLSGTIDKKKKVGRRIMNLCSSIVLQNPELETEWIKLVTQKGYCAFEQHLKNNPFDTNFKNFKEKRRQQLLLKSPK